MYLSQSTVEQLAHEMPLSGINGFGLGSEMFSPGVNPFPLLWDIADGEKAIERTLPEPITEELYRVVEALPCRRRPKAMGLF